MLGDQIRLGQASGNDAYSCVAGVTTNGARRASTLAEEPGESWYSWSNFSSHRYGCDTMKYEEMWVTRLFGLLSQNLSSQFTGLGVILYRPPMVLPVTSLLPPGQEPMSKVLDVADNAKFLRTLSDSSGDLHDGFHLIDVEQLAITHVCQYVAPPIPAAMPNGALPYPVGARYMTALLASLLPSVVLSAMLNKREGAVAFVDGRLRRLDVESVEG
jgi:hypothetical protein